MFHRGMFLRCFGLVVVALSLAAVRADGPGDNAAEKVRPVPPPGLEVPAEVRRELETGLAQLGGRIAALESALAKKPALKTLVPDVEIFHKAVRVALDHGEFFSTNEFAAARELIEKGIARAAELERGEPSWPKSTGLVVRAYRSKIDGSVQPYGLVVPAGVAFAPEMPRRLDAWFHGRDEKLSELNFLRGRLNSPGEFVPPNSIVLHLYGRYCNANKFAGEIDLFEALDDVKARYAVDEDRLVVRGFSMGGAACWQFATHYAGLWAAAAPGAGFSETREFLRVFQNEPVAPAWWEQKLWHWYDATDYALNLFNCPTVAYSGEIDKQKQAADIMARALEEEGLELTHIIGPQTGHKYHPEAKREIDRRVDSIVRRGRDPMPLRVRFTTWTLRYNRMHWVTVDQLGEHWERARVDALVEDEETVTIDTDNVDAITLDMPAGHCPLNAGQVPTVMLDGAELSGPPVGTDRSWIARFQKVRGEWQPRPGRAEAGLRKRHGLQGPIDDAFMDSFIMVAPSGEPLNAKAGAWAAAEQKHAIDHWRKQFRGDARVVRDTELLEGDLPDANLVLWGDPRSNKLLAKIIDRLPLRWSADGLMVDGKSFDSGHHVPALIFPNPLKPNRYVVLNSGFTFREYDYLNNARQIAKLPDWAVIDIAKPVTARSPGEIVHAGFFDEAWKYKPAPASAR